MARDESVPYWDTGDTLTAHAEAAVTGKRFVAISGPRTDGNPTVSHAAAGGPVFGVSGYTVPAGAKVTIHHQPAIVVPVTVGAVAVVAGNPVVSDAEGRAVPAGAGVVGVGIALDDAAPGADVPIDRTVRAVGA